MAFHSHFPRSGRAAGSLAFRLAQLLVLTLPLVAAAQPDMEDFPPHPGGRVEIDRIVHGPLPEPAIQTVLATLPPLLERCAIARARRETVVSSSHAFDLTIDAAGRATSNRLELDPAEHPPAHEVAWLSCARRLLSRLRFPAAEEATEVRLRLIWMLDDQPHGDGLL